ncbi:NAD dependent epimerase-like protein 4 [Elsinoe australis]|uniref:NAD dependent epimerase-like protein 4 n=1 Tax=Elsinoe australis TaxID=40998 RepID=A0A4U7B6E4_9PEZI|nr:NAD dependent epimerase-like protein 4 [Elsinoe australis]
MSQAKPKILITGATGYIGGTVLETLLTSPDPSLRDLPISVAVRSTAHNPHFTSRGVTVHHLSSLDDTTTLRTIASQHDIVLHLASGFHPTAAQALIHGLADRKTASAADVTFIHLTGCSNIGDRPLSLGLVDSRVHSDRDDVLSLLREREKVWSYAQRRTDIVVTETGAEKGVRTYIVMLPLIFGFGTGVAKLNRMLYGLAAADVKRGVAGYIGDGQGTWGVIDVRDAAELFACLVGKVVRGTYPDSGEKGWFFGCVAEMRYEEWAAKNGEAGLRAGALKRREPKSVSLEEQAADSGWPVEMAEALATNARIRSERWEELGWEPKRGRAGWDESWTEMMIEVYKDCM